MNFNRLLSYINFDLWLLNWLVIPVKIVVYVIATMITRMVEPYSTPKKKPEINNNGMREFAKATAERLALFRYQDHTVSSFRGVSPDGRNHDDGDWCLLSGVLYVFRASNGAHGLDEVVSFIDGEGRLSRGWKWDDNGNKIYNYNISGDQIAGFVFALSAAPVPELRKHREPILRFIDSIIDNNYIVPDNDGRSYWRDYRMGILAYGGMVPTILALMYVGWLATANEYYMKKFRRFLVRGAAIAVAVPFGSLFDCIHGYVWNVTILALAALRGMVGKRWWIDFGIRWVWWVNRRQYNPLWTAIAARYIRIPEDDLHHAAYQLSTVGASNYYSMDMRTGDYDKFYGDEPIHERRYFFRLFGRRHTSLPPRYSLKSCGDDFLFQRTDRQVSDYGEKIAGTEDWRYNMAYYLLAYRLFVGLR